MSNSPGPVPFLPQVLMNLPSFVNFTMRALVLPPWPSATKMSPFGAITTADGALNSIRTAAGDVRLAERHQHLAVGAELENLVAFAAAAEPVGHPHVALAVDVQTVREQQQAGAEALQQFSGRIEFEDRVEVRAAARERLAGIDARRRPGFAAALADPDAGAIGIDGDRAGRTPCPALRQAFPSSRSNDTDSAANWSARWSARN